ncbi:N-acetyltransferase [Olsenella sp. HMSC062G07]|uniref:GNAT family N-acetyltransferase n=1 Tax=Olsenella sp. HMSC062G07 TaxID=1739330 RepID=UPI0008A5741F|nr:GNAT family N-acetyltransferase [Olsenella sp. HMSC062G07]OFK24811.1 GNAT family acetyltransferase [Olsenella sp. HMSC062G07]
MPALADSSQPFGYRPFEGGDFDAVTDMCARAWYKSVEGVYDRIIFGRVLTAGALRRSSIMQVATKGDRVVGACFGGVCLDGVLEKNDKWKRSFEDTMAIARKRAKLGGIAVEERLFSKLRMFTVADVFISRGFTNSQAEFNLLVVHPLFQRQGIGQTLFDAMLAAFVDAGAQGCFGVVDDDFDSEFMRKHGLSVVESRRGAAGDSGRRTVSLLARRL